MLSRPATATNNPSRRKQAALADDERQASPTVRLGANCNSRTATRSDDSVNGWWPAGTRLSDTPPSDPLAGL
jgi:hypothetical protein